MPDPALYALTWRVVRRRLVRSPVALAAPLAFPALVVWIGCGDSYGTAAKFFFFLLPHVFLVAAQDAVRTDVESGALESVLFLGGRFRGYLRAKLFVLAAVAGVYVAVLFALFAAWGLAVGGFESRFVVRFGLAVLAGLYYLAVAGALSHGLRAGSNVLVVLLAQAVVVIGLIVSVTPRTGLLDHAATGRFPGSAPSSFSPASPRSCPTSSSPDGTPPSPRRSWRDSAWPSSSGNGSFAGSS
ncbi:MAG: hypothetical protein M0C28_00995 [Candidatus Moduliflexus flocculans]|nr:hypothetical protein [Candidatus Moduliflexus flocculans]